MTPIILDRKTVDGAQHELREMNDMQGTYYAIVKLGLSNIAHTEFIDRQRNRIDRTWSRL